MNIATTYLTALAAAMLLTGCESPLSQATQRGDTTQIQQLLDKGADINAKSNGRTPLMWAAQNGNKVVLEQLLSKGANINATGIFGWTALILAAQQGHTDCVKVLLEHGANMDQRTDSLPGMTSQNALEWARSGGHTRTVQLLEAASRNGGMAAKDAAQPAVPTTLPPPTDSAAPF
jgi:ankyrin repeat protein